VRARIQLSRQPEMATTIPQQQPPHELPHTQILMENLLQPLLLLQLSRMEIKEQ